MIALGLDLRFVYTIGSSPLESDQFHLHEAYKSMHQVSRESHVVLMRLFSGRRGKM
jgi:hypothetical protein